MSAVDESRPRTRLALVAALLRRFARAPAEGVAHS